MIELLFLSPLTNFVMSLDHRQQPQQSRTLAKLKPCAHPEPARPKVQRSLQHRHMLVFAVSWRSKQKSSLQRSVLFIYFFSNIDPDVGGGGSGNCIETRVAVVICFMYPSMLKAEFKLFFFCPQQKPGPVQLSALHSSTNAAVFLISWKSAEKCHGNLVIFYLFITLRSSV